jgi:DNA-binding NtrC family response regulator
MTADNGSSSTEPPVVFFVDDDDSIRSVYSTVMRKHGVRVLEAASADEAGRLVEIFTEPIDVLLMDVNLPDGWGSSVAQRLSESHPEMVVIYTTGFADTDPILSGALKDAPFVLRKPFSSAELLQTIQEAMRASHGHPAH